MKEITIKMSESEALSLRILLGQEREKFYSASCYATGDIKKRLTTQSNKIARLYEIIKTAMEGK